MQGDKIEGCAVRSIGLNQIVLELGPDEYLFSYGTLCAAFVSGVGFVKSDRKYSVTTSRHVNGWAGRVACVPVTMGVLVCHLADSMRQVAEDLPSWAVDIVEGVR